MSDELAYAELADSWLRSATSDLGLAQIALVEAFYPQTCFLCQQVAEKSLKAYLLAQRQPFVRTHVLPRLQHLAQQQDSEFEQVREACGLLTGYYVDTRYPDVGADLAAFDRGVAEEAVQLAESVLILVRERIEQRPRQG